MHGSDGLSSAARGCPLQKIGELDQIGTVGRPPYTSYELTPSHLTYALLGQESRASQKALGPG